MNTNTLLQLEGLSIDLHSDQSSQFPKGVLSLTDNISFHVKRGELFGLAGESGCGKTITAQAVMRFLPQPGGRIKSGKIYFEGEDLLLYSSAAMQSLRGRKIGMIFQEPSSALNPLIPLGLQLEEVFKCHREDTAEDSKLKDSKKRIQDLLYRMGFVHPDRILLSYPHELSGGMLQRVMIAMALLLKPKLLIADEPTTALDVTIQAQVMELLLENCREEGTAVLFITHNLGLIAQYADRLSIMYAGRLVESAPVADFFAGPLHPYSLGLIEAFPDISGKKNRSLSGHVPSPQEYEKGCRFRSRCPYAFLQCMQTPSLKKKQNEQEAACFLYSLSETERQKKMEAAVS